MLRRRTIRKQSRPEGICGRRSLLALFSSGDIFCGFPGSELLCIPIGVNFWKGLMNFFEKYKKNNNNAQKIGNYFSKI